MSLCCPLCPPWGPSLSLGAICLPTGLPTEGSHLAGSLLPLRAHVFLGMPARPGSQPPEDPLDITCTSPDSCCSPWGPGCKGPWESSRGRGGLSPLSWHPLLPPPFPLRANGSPERGAGLRGQQHPLLGRSRVVMSSTCQPPQQPHPVTPRNTCWEKPAARPVPGPCPFSSGGWGSRLAPLGSNPDSTTLWPGLTVSQHLKLRACPGWGCWC